MPGPTPRRRALARAALAAALALGVLAVARPAPPPHAATAEVEPVDTRAYLMAQGIPVTRGAAPGYVPDAVCASCHADLARSFAEVAMAQSFYRPLREGSPERFGEEYVHLPSRQHFAMEWRGERLVFRRWQLDERGGRVHELEQEVGWVLGSGNHARTYLFRTPSGELWQLPIAWYAEGGWGMAPGFDRPDHEGVLRLVQRECLVCHNAYAEVPAGEDRFGAPHRFPPELPLGIGCQRCHGPGAEHVRRARDPEAPLATVGAAVVNPARLPRERRMDVCYQCHLQPSVALPAVRVFARGDFAFRPGEELSAHRVELDPVEEGHGREARFEINHHPYRLEQSPCFLASGGELTCLTCHDPHAKPPLPARLARYRAVCLDCHQVDALHGVTDGGSTATAVAATTPLAADCTSCHMPRRRPTDVVRVTLTDHRIQVPPAGVDLTAAREERDPVLLDATLLHPQEAPSGAMGELYRATGLLRAGARRVVVPSLERLLAQQGVFEPEPWLRLGEAQLLLGEHAAAEATLRRLLAQVPELPLLRSGLGIAAAAQGRQVEALAHLREGLAIEPDLAEGHFNLGRLLLAYGRPAEARPALARAVALRPNFPAGWLRLGQALEALGDRRAAIACYQRALAVEPATTDAHLALVAALRSVGERAAAEEALALGLRYARRPEELRAPSP